MAKVVLAVIFFGLISISPLVYAGPQLANDFAAGGQWAPADDLAVKKADCKRWYFLVSTCDIQYVVRFDPSQVGGTLSYLVFGSWSGERIRLMRSITDPGTIGTTVGIEHMRQRLISFGVFALLALAYLIGFLRFVMQDKETSQPVVMAASAAPEPSISPAGPRTFGRRPGGGGG